MIGKLQRLRLREVWPHEAHDFTTWLEDHIDELNDVLDRRLSKVEREEPAGAFSADLVAEDQDGNLVVIENQLERSNHDHLGKLITYLTLLDAKVGVWIVADPRPEHVGALAWLNENSAAASFYLLKVEAVRIGDSDPAPLLTLITGPSEEARQAGETKKELAERYVLRQRFWESLLERSKERTKLFSNISASQYSWIGTGTGIRGVTLTYMVRQHDAQVEVYIDRGKDAEEENKAIFDQLSRSRRQIETIFGDELEWQRLENRRACRIRKLFALGGYREQEEKWQKVQDALIDAMVRLEKAFKPHIAKLTI